MTLSLKVGECGMKKVAVSVAQDEAVLEAVREAKKQRHRRCNFSR